MKFDLAVFNMSMKSSRTRRDTNSQGSNLQTGENLSLLVGFQSSVLYLDSAEHVGVAITRKRGAWFESRPAHQLS
jgi:hypothetical protein